VNLKVRTNYFGLCWSIQHGSVRIVIADSLTHCKAADSLSPSSFKLTDIRLVLGHCIKSTSGQDLHQYAVHRHMSNAIFGTSSNTRYPMDL